MAERNSPGKSKFIILKIKLYFLKIGVQLYTAPLKHQLKIVYQNVDLQNQLTTEALRTCQSLGIDYKELIPRPEVLKEAGSSMIDYINNHPMSIKQKQHEIKRARRICQIAKIIEDSRNYDSGINNRKGKIQ